MTTAPTRLLTVNDYARLGEPDYGYTELQEGRVILSPSPSPRHAKAEFWLGVQLDPQIPAGFEFRLDQDVDLGLVPRDRPGTARRPDLVVVTAEAIERVDREGGLLRAAETLLVVEIVSPGSIRMDNVIKRGEYADAGIPHYWIIDLDDPVSLVDCHLAGEFGYQDNGGVTGEFVTTVPFPVRIDLQGLL
jgi:Uma2 family endonuclease